MSKDHFIPKFYLKGFLNDVKKIPTYNKKYNKCRDFSPSGIYYQEDLNKIDLKEFGIINLETAFFQNLDDKYAKAFKTFCNEYQYCIQNTPIETLIDIVEFFIGLAWRSPYGYSNIKEIIENDSLLNGVLSLVDDRTGNKMKDADIPKIIEDIKSKKENQKCFMSLFYQENIIKHDWSCIREKLQIFTTNEPMIIGNTTCIPIKTDYRRGLFFEEFIVPFDKNHVLIYAKNKPVFYESKLHHLLNMCIISMSERIACSDERYLMDEIKYAKETVEKFGNMTPASLIAKWINILSRFKSYDQYCDYFYLHKT